MGKTDNEILVDLFIRMMKGRKNCKLTDEESFVLDKHNIYREYGWLYFKVENPNVNNGVFSTEYQSSAYSKCTNYDWCARKTITDYAKFRELLLKVDWIDRTKKVEKRFGNNVANRVLINNGRVGYEQSTYHLNSKFKNVNQLWAERILLNRKMSAKVDELKCLLADRKFYIEQAEYAKVERDKRIENAIERYRVDINRYTHEYEEINKVIRVILPTAQAETA